MIKMSPEKTKMLKNLIAKSIKQDDESRVYYENSQNEVMANYYLGKVNALNSVMFYFQDEEVD